jgi:hypothetical protein
MDRDVSFTELDAKGEDYLCPHMVPSPMMLMWFPEGNYADYAIVNGTINLAELSFVMDGNCSAAGVMRK